MVQPGDGALYIECADPECPAHRVGYSHAHLDRTWPADHPHEDPGDGRTECDVCGKYIWPVIHSCKGIPVTERAKERWRRKN